MTVSPKLEIIVRELKEKGYSSLYIESFIEGFYVGYFKAKTETARNMLKEGFELDVVLRITGLTEQDLKDYGVI
ncbi:hypothetical protein [Leptospira santarosai]|uniref:hypothetical protein n=1 Tax=Leptospira santarosai TaxID=28183 RepID=UPI0005186191|nr:hypothetical protein [Leptospira santarosai]MDI7165313.1 hypothetical protein [Leptospira santarosai]MDI7182886.1 hypothetical protein [Leptospira santarosai]MDO6383289.1 hypothetical protein [Leptospira santarosai]